jgi:hypothetical protein
VHAVLVGESEPDLQAGSERRIPVVTKDQRQRRAKSHRKGGDVTGDELPQDDGCGRLLEFVQRSSSDSRSPYPKSPREARGRVRVAFLRTVYRRYGIVGLFAKKEVLFEFTVEHTRDFEILYQSNGSDLLKCPSYAYYLDQLVFNVGDDYASAVSGLIFRAALEGMTIGTDAEVVHPFGEGSHIDLAYTVGQGISDDRLVAEAQLCKKGKRVFIDTKFSPKSWPETEKTVASGCESLFLDLFNIQPDVEQAKGFSAAIYAQTSWYMNNGRPSVGQLGVAPVVGFAGATKTAWYSNIMTLLNG